MEISLGEPALLVLTALAGEPRHGYGLIAEISRLSSGRVSLRPGSLYAVLDRLGDAGLVALDREETVDGRLRRYYKLSEQGRLMLVAVGEQVRRLAGAAVAKRRRGLRAAWATVAGTWPAAGGAV